MNHVPEQAVSGGEHPAGLDEDGAARVAPLPALVAEVLQRQLPRPRARLRIASADHEEVRPFPRLLVRLGAALEICGAGQKDVGRKSVPVKRVVRACLIHSRNASRGSTLNRSRRGARRTSHAAAHVRLPAAVCDRDSLHKNSTCCGKIAFAKKTCELKCLFHNQFENAPSVAKSKTRLQPPNKTCEHA